MARKKKVESLEELELLESEENSKEVQLGSGFLKILPLILTVSLFIAFILLVVFIDFKVRDSEKFEFQSNSLEVGNKKLPDWIINDGLLQKIELVTKDVKDSYMGFSYFDQNVAGDLRSALLKNPWLNDISVEKKYPNRLLIYPQFRKPVAAVLSKNKYWYVLDETCQVMPVVEKQGSEQMNLIRIDCKDTKAVKFELGKVVDAIYIKKSIGLMRLFANEYDVPKDLTRIEVAYNESEKIYQYTLRFASGLEIFWGDFLFTDEIDAFPDKQLSSNQKIQLLQDQLKDQPNRLHASVEFKNK